MPSLQKHGTMKDLKKYGREGKHAAREGSQGQVAQVGG